MSSADAPSAAVRTMIAALLGVEPLDDLLQARALGVVEPARDAEALALRDEDEEAAGERDLGREPRALRLHRVLDRLHEDLLAAGDQVGDLLAVPLALELGHDDLVDVEEAVLLEADLDERGLHPGQHVVDGAEVDVAGDRAALGPLEVDLGDAVVLEDGDTLLADVDGDQELALRLRQRRALRRHAAARCVARPLLALACARAPCARASPAGRLLLGPSSRPASAALAPSVAGLLAPAAAALPRRRRFLRRVCRRLGLGRGGRLLSRCGLLDGRAAGAPAAAPPARSPSCASSETRVQMILLGVSAREDTAAKAAGRALRMCERRGHGLSHRRSSGVRRVDPCAVRLRGGGAQPRRDARGRRAAAG